MKQLLNDLSDSQASPLRARVGWSAGIAVALAASAAFACSEASPPTPPVSGGGSGGQGQAMAGTGGTGVVAGAAGTATGGMPATSGAAGMAGKAGSGGTGGTGSGGGSGGASGGSGGAAGGSGGSGGGGGGADSGFVPIFNGTDLTGWTPSQGHAGLFAAEKLGDDSVIHVYPSAQLKDGDSGVPQAALRTVKSYSKYVFSLEYKWGIKRFNERAGKARDNGIVFHICNDAGKVWPDSVEFQLGSDAWGNDWVSGNIFMLVENTRAKWPSATLNGKKAFSETGTRANLGAPTSYALGLNSEQLDKPTEWNTVELTVNGSMEAEYKVNGKVVNRLFDMEYRMPNSATFMPLDHGPIAVQAEFAEVYFRNIKIKDLAPTP